MSTKVRTVSDLTELFERPGNTDLIEISHTQDGGQKYSSRKYKFESLISDISSIALESVAEKWNIDEDEDLTQIADYIDTVSSAVQILDNQFRFKHQPIIENDDLLDNSHDNALQTKKQVENTIFQRSAYLTNTSFVECDPANDNGWTKDYQYFWKIENGEYDSSEALDEDGFQIGGITINRTGYLTIYGWLASNANVSPQNAWVGLYGFFNEKWILIQVQPWIIGKNSQMLQYIGFNIPVRSGIRLKIMTGFPVNGNVTGMHQYSHTLLLSDKGNVVNSFVGYVIEN